LMRGRRERRRSLLIFKTVPELDYFRNPSFPVIRGDQSSLENNTCNTFRYRLAHFTVYWPFWLYGCKDGFFISLSRGF
jgi:hypothetical protein